MAPAVRCPRYNAAACHPPKEKRLRASESSISCKSCFHLAGLCLEMVARIVVAYRRVVVDVLKGDRQTSSYFTPPEMSEFAVAAYVSGPAGQACTPSHPPLSLPPVRRYALNGRRPHQLEARSEQRAPAADTTTGMMLSKMQPQKEPRRGNLQARARAHRQSV